MVRLDADREAYVSYRKDERIYWTKNKVRLHKGELVLTDGQTVIRSRCGNQVCETPQSPVARAADPPLPEFDIPSTSVMAIPSLLAMPIFAGIGWPDGDLPDAAAAGSSPPLPDFGVSDGSTPSGGSSASSGGNGASGGGSGPGHSPGVFHPPGSGGVNSLGSSPGPPAEPGRPTPPGTSPRSSGPHLLAGGSGASSPGQPPASPQIPEIPTLSLDPGTGAGGGGSQPPTDFPPTPYVPGGTQPPIVIKPGVLILAQQDPKGGRDRRAADLPIPEPPSWVMMSLAAALLCVKVRVGQASR